MLKMSFLLYASNQRNISNKKMYSENRVKRVESNKMWSIFSSASSGAAFRRSGSSASSWSNITNAIRRLPDKTARIELDLRPPLGLDRAQFLLDLFGRHAQNVLAAPVLDEPERIERLDDVDLGESRHLREVIDR